MFVGLPPPPSWGPETKGGASTLQKSIAIIPKVGGALSLIAGTFIVRDVIVRWRDKQSVPLTSAIVFCISVADWLFSFFGCFLSTWMAPPDSGLYLASGNTQSCTAQGFVVALSAVAYMMYYALLMVLFWLIVRFGWKDRKLNKASLRLSFTLIPVIIALGIAVPPLFFGMYNAASFTCFLEEYPLGCEQNPNVDCTRGKGATPYWQFFWAFIIFCNIIIIVSVFMLICEVLSKERKTDKYLARGQEKMRQNTMETFWQGMRYVGAFLLAHFPTYIMGVYIVKGEISPEGLYYTPEWLYYLVVVLTPLFGLFNSYAYFRPRYISFRKRNPGEGRMKCLAYVLKLDLYCFWNEAGRRSSSESGENGPGDDIANPLLQHEEERRDESGSVVV